MVAWAVRPMSNPPTGGSDMGNGGQGSLLEVLEPAARRQLLARARVVRARKGQTIVSRGEASTDVFIVQEGRVQAVIYAADGREVSLRELSEGQLWGELSAIDGAARSVAVVAAADVRMLAIDETAFREVVESSPKATDWLVRRLVGQIRSLTDRVFELSALNVQTRLHCELLRLAKARGGEIDPSPTHAELASRVATHREAVTRELNALETRGVLRSGRRRLVFLDVERLEREVRAKLRAPIADDRWW